MRKTLSEEQWLELFVQLRSHGVFNTKNLRKIVEGIIWKLRTGAPWRDLPTECGPWKSVYNRFNEWSRKGIWQKVFLKIRGDFDMEWAMVDSSSIKVHQHGISKKGLKAKLENIGKTVGGRTTKIHMLGDSHGNPVDFISSPGEVHDIRVVARLVEDYEFDNFLGDRAYKSKNLKGYIKKGF